MTSSRFGLSVSDDTIYRALKDLAFSHVSARPKAYKQDAHAIAGAHLSLLNPQENIWQFMGANWLSKRFRDCAKKPPQCG
jgi:hypothetical protein